ncbi:MAG: hypothetical protein RLZZ387_3297 [Chloroflexota bacterium]|jgi:hypothetical protein
MGKAERHSEFVRAVLQHDVREHPHPVPGIESAAICDDTTGHYLIMYVGWSSTYRARDVIVHISVRRDGIVQIEHDGTEESVVPALIAAGIDPDDIVLAFQSPRSRVTVRDAITREGSVR